MDRASAAPDCADRQQRCVRESRRQNAIEFKNVQLSIGRCKYLSGGSRLKPSIVEPVDPFECCEPHSFEAIPDTTAASTFVALHVPLFFPILWHSHHPARRISSGTKLVVSAFMVVHAILHFALSSSAQYSLHGLLSSLPIYGAAVLGAAFLAACWTERRRSEAAWSFSISVRSTRACMGRGHRGECRARAAHAALLLTWHCTFRSTLIAFWH